MPNCIYCHDDGQPCSVCGDGREASCAGKISTQTDENADNGGEN